MVLLCIGSRSLGAAGKVDSNSNAPPVNHFGKTTEEMFSWNCQMSMSESFYECLNFSPGSFGFFACYD